MTKLKKSSSPEPLNQFQPNLAQSILGWQGLKFVQMKGPALFQGEINTKSKNKLTKFKKSSSPEPRTEPISTKLGTKHPWVKGNQVCSNERPRPFQRGDNYEISKKKTLTKFKILLVLNHLANITQTWHKASLGEGESSLFKWRAPPFSKGR